MRSYQCLAHLHNSPVPSNLAQGAYIARSGIYVFYIFPSRRLKGASDECATGLQAAAGLYHVVANHEHVLVRHQDCFSPKHIDLTLLYRIQADAVQHNFEQPLRQHLDEYRANTAVR